MDISSLVKWKNPKDEAGLKLVDPRLKEVMLDCAMFCKVNGFEFVVTALLSDALKDVELGRVSSSHTEGRAFDLRCKNWPESFIMVFMKYIFDKHGSKGAPSKSDGKQRIAVRHTGTSDHIHVQVSRRNK